MSATDAVAGHDGAATPSPARSPRPPLSDQTALRKAMRRCAFALVLLALAGLRHHLFWGATNSSGIRLKPWLDAGETACLFGFAWFGTRGWLAAIAAVRERSPGLRALVRATLPLLLLAVVVPAFLSADLADYVMRGRVAALHGGNPYIDLATSYAHDPFVGFGDRAWKQFPLPYGPLVADLQGALAWLGAQCSFVPPRAQFVVTLALFKLVFAACVLGAAWCARDLHARLHGSTGAGSHDADAAFVAVAWCPLLLNETIAQGHNEALLSLTLLLALRATLAAQHGLGALALGAGVLTKLVPALIAPLQLVVALRARRMLPFVLGGAVAGAIAAWYWHRFFAAPGGLAFLARQSEFTSGSLVRTVARLLGIDVASALLVGRAIVVVVMVVACVRLWRTPTAARLIAGSAATLAAMACCGLAGVGPWYHVWWVPLALLLPAGFLHRFAVAIVWLAPLAYLRWTSARAFDETHDAIALAMGTGAPALFALFARWPQHAVVVSRR